MEGAKNLSKHLSSVAMRGIGDIGRSLRRGRNMDESYMLNRVSSFEFKNSSFELQLNKQKKSNTPRPTTRYSSFKLVTRVLILETRESNFSNPRLGAMDCNRGGGSNGTCLQCTALWAPVNEVCNCGILAVLLKTIEIMAIAIR